mgnify:CR=1 FL=1
MLRIFLLQNLYDLSDMKVMNEVIDSRAFSDFCGVDKDSGLVHHLKVTGANEHDVTAAPDLMHGEEKELYGDSGYIGTEKRENAVVKQLFGYWKTRYRGLLKQTAKLNIMFAPANLYPADRKSLTA